MKLNSEERGIYRELLDHLYYTGSLPNDEQILYKICTVSQQEWNRSWPKVRRFFVRDGRGLKNKKASEVIDKLDKYAKDKGTAGKLGATKRWHGTPNGTANSKSIGVPSSKNSQPQPQPLPSTPAPAATPGATEPSVSSTFVGRGVQRESGLEKPPVADGVFTEDQEAALENLQNGHAVDTTKRKKGKPDPQALKRVLEAERARRIKAGEPADPETMQRMEAKLLQ